MELERLSNYAGYLGFLETKFQKFFESQKDFIFCYKGCGKCCKNAMFPYSEVEFQYLLFGATQLPIEQQNLIQERIKEILAKKKKFRGKYFRYDCPFLIDNICSVYNHRGIVCRAFGLMTNGKDGGQEVPFCCFKGLNYSNVINLKTRKLSPRKYKKINTKQEPASFNVNYKFLTDPDFEKGFNFKFGEKKALIDWFDTNKL